MDLGDVDDLAVERVSVVDQVAQRLRTMIADGRLGPGERLREVALAGVFGVSRPIVRDAIRMLTVEGLAVHVMHRGAVVRTLSADDISDLYSARLALELLGLDHWQAAAPERRQELEAILRRCAASARANDSARFAEDELAFHLAIVGLVENRRITDFFSQLIRELRLAYGLVAEAESPNTIVRRYRRILRSLRAERPDEARRILRGHLDWYETELRKIIDAALRPHEP